MCDSNQEHEHSPDTSRFLFVGNNLAIDLVNTEVIANDERVDLLGSFANVIDWLADAGVVDSEEASQLQARWSPEECDNAFAAVRTFRAALRHGAERLTGGGDIGDDVLQAVNDMLLAPVRRSRVVRGRDGTYMNETILSFATPLDVLAPIAEAAAELLCGGDLRLVKKCRNPKCILYYYDTTRNHRRSWCSMSVCGNRTKVAAYYKRRRDAAT